MRDEGRKMNDCCTVLYGYIVGDGRGNQEHTMSYPYNVLGRQFNWTVPQFDLNSILFGGTDRQPPAVRPMVLLPVLSVQSSFREGESLK